MQTLHSPAGRAVLAAAAVASLCGCAELFVRADWNDKPTSPPLQPLYYEVDPSQLALDCKIALRPGETLYGCARRDYRLGACLVFTGPNPAAWLLEHERKHCAGWEHGPHNAPADETSTAAGG